MLILFILRLCVERCHGQMARATHLWWVKSPQDPEFEPRLDNPPNGPVLNPGKLRQQKERDELCLLYAVHKVQWASNPHCP